METNITVIDTGLKPRVLEEIKRIVEKYKLNKVILFDSRARGDYSRISDIDLAVSGGDITNFAIEIEEEVYTLLTFDVIDLDKNLNKDLFHSIQIEEVAIYEEV